MARKKKLVTWVHAQKQPHGEKEHYNFLSIRGGKFHLADFDTFFKLLNRDYVKLSQTNAFPLVFRGPRHTPSPFYLDVDLLLKDDVSIPTSVFIELAHQFLLHLKIVTNTNDIWKVIISRRTGSYTKGKKGLSNGFHMLIPDLLVTPAVMTCFRDAVLADGYWFDLLKEFHVSNSPEEIIDKSVTTRRNGLILIGLNKPLTEGNSPCSAHYICYYDQWRNVWYGDMEPLPFGWQFENKKRNGEYKQLIEMCYRWVADHDYSKAEVPAPVSAPASPVAPVESHGKFNLPYFLEILGNNELPHTEWKQLIAFCKGQGLSKDFTCRVVNEHCMPQDPLENTRMFEHAESTGPCQVGKGSIVRMLRNFELDFDDLKLFPRKVWKYHSDSVMFREHGKVWKRSDIQNYFEDVYSYTWGNGLTEFIYKEQRTRRLGNESYTSCDTVITGLPFSKTETDIRLLVEPSHEQLRNSVKRVVKQKKQHYNEEQSISHSFRVKKGNQLLASNASTLDLATFLGPDYPEPSEESLYRMFVLAKQRGLLPKRYHRLTVEPYLYKDNSPSDTLNIFPGFEMMRFENDPANIKSTPFWTWLWVAWSDRSLSKLNWLLNYFAVKLQHPDRKVTKYLIAYARIQGCGKTSVRTFLNSIFDRNKVLFLESVEQYMQNENCEFLGKTFAVVDDVDLLNRSQSTALKAKITSSTFRYKELYKNKKTLPCFLDLIATSNREKPAFVEADCRRSELIRVNPELVNNKEFWDSFYSSAQSTQNNGMWFHYLANFPITIDVSSKLCRFDNVALQVQKINSMKLVHRFVASYFENPEFLEAPSKIPKFETNWFSKVRFFKTDGIKSLFIAKQRLYDSFQWWRTSSGQTLNCKMTTFVDGLEELGITQTRKLVENRKLTGFVFRAPYVRKGLKTYYKLNSFALHWSWLDEQEFTAYSKGTWRYR